MLFAPEDLELVRGDPAERRRYLDELLVTRQPRYAGVRADYERVVKQRNALLRTLVPGPPHRRHRAAVTCRRWMSGTPSLPGTAPSCSPDGWSW